VELFDGTTVESTGRTVKRRKRRKRRRKEKREKEEEGRRDRKGRCWSRAMNKTSQPDEQEFPHGL
jgi:hypothetical protein